MPTTTDCEPTTALLPDVEQLTLFPIASDAPTVDDRDRTDAAPRCGRAEPTNALEVS
jgi:hypothetical protein